MPQHTQYNDEQLMASFDLPQEGQEVETADDENERGLLSRLWGGITRTGKAAYQGAKRGVSEGIESLTPSGVQEEWDEGRRELSSHMEGSEELEDDIGFRPLEVGERESGAYGFVEGATQFAVGMLGARKLLAPVGALKGAGSLARTAAEGAIADLTVFDPFEERLADLVQDTRFANPLTEMLQADEDDSEAIARLKQAGEGLVVGTTLDLVVAGVRGVRARRAHRKGKLTDAELVQKTDEIINGIDEAAAKSDEPITVEHNPGEPSVIRVRQENLFDDGTMDALTSGIDEGIDIVSEGIQVADPARAESLAAGLNMVAKNRQIPRDQLTDLQRDAVKASVRRLVNGESEEEVLRGLASQINLNSIQTPEEVQAWIKAFSAEASEQAKALANRGSRESPTDPSRANPSGRTWEQTIRNGIGWAFGMQSDKAMARRLSKVFDETENLDGIQYGAKAWLVSRTNRIAEISEKIETAADPRVLEKELDDSVDALWDAYNHIVGISANIARGQQAARIPVKLEDLPARPSVHDDAVERSAVKGKAPEGEPKPSERNPGTPVGKREGSRVTEENLTRSGKTSLPGNAPHIRRIEKPTDRLSQRLTKSQKRAFARSFILTKGEPRKVLDAMRITRHVMEKPEDPSRWDKLISFRANMMLSGPKTQMVNFVGNMTAAFQVPMEMYYAGKRFRNSEQAKAGADIMTQNAMFIMESATALGKTLGAKAGLFEDKEYFSEGMQAVRETWRRRRNVLDPEQTQLEHQEYATVAAPRRWMGRLLESFGSRALMTSDEFFKQMSYRSHVASQSMALSRRHGVDDKVMARRLSEDLHMAFDREGGATNVNALSHARYTTFTDKLEHGYGQKLQDIANDHPTARLLFLPFVRTPVNLFRFSLDRTPGLNRLSKRWQDDIAAGGQRAQLAQARTELGSLVWAMGGLMAYNNVITGRGPSDPEMRRHWLAAGNQPYSFQVAGKQISFRRLEPFATPFAVLADIFDISGEIGETEMDKLAGAFIVGMTSAVTSKTFLQGIVDAFEVFATKSEDRAERFFREYTASFVVPNLIRQTNPDDTWREVRSIVGEYQSRVWWLSEGLEPTRNILGEPIRRPPGYGNRSFNPFTMMDAPEDESVLQQLVDLGKAMPMPRTTWAEGRIDIRDGKQWVNKDPERAGQSPHDRWLELVADPPGNHPSLRERLTALMETEGWNNASDGNSTYKGGLKYEMASGIVTKHYETMKQVMLSEYPDLRMAQYEDKRNKARSLFDAIDQ